MIDREKFKALAKEREALEGANKDRIAAFDLRAQDAGIDPAGLKRFVAWKRQDEQRRAQKEAIDQQCRYLAGERDTPAELPLGCELAQAINLYRRNMTVRQVADELNISSGKAGKLRELARMFVHVHDRVDKPKAKKPPTVVTPPEVAALPAHNVETGEITDSRVASGADDCGAGVVQSEPAVSLAGEAEAPAPITETAPDTPPSPAPEFGVGPGTESCGPCPVPPGSVPPTSDGNGLRTKGKAEPLADSPREHTLAGCDGVLAEQVTTPQSEDRASPGPQDPKPPAFSPEAREKLNSVAAAKPDLYQRITGAFKPLVRDDDDLIIPPFLRRSA